MALIVQKYGGTSVGTVERIKNAAKRISETVNEGNRVVVVVSAMGKSTDQLVNLANEITEQPSKREMDMLLTTGEQVSISLLTMALQQLGYEAVSLTGWQAGIQTEDCFGNARITAIHTERIQEALRLNKIVVVAGFQGVTAGGEIATLGRGGSDTTAVALAAALKAEKCEIFTDVKGVYTTDPRVVSHARKLEAISYDEMLEMANLGAGVLHPRAVEFAKNYHVTLEVRSSLEKESGTIVEEEPTMEQNLIVKGLAFKSNITKVTVSGMPNRLTTLADVFTLLASNGINVDIIIQEANGETVNISFSISSDVLDDALQVLESNRSRLAFEAIYHQQELAKVSIVGSGMISNPGVAAQMFDVLANSGVMIEMVSTSEIKISTVVAQDKMTTAIEGLHEAFKLDLREPIAQ
ncbi:aspartate kinase [Bacillus taeanensis]|uniref:Aspartokinase n=1 Tax=Bacillus taeanensis TaxID=273032 RepID=A0A366Y551_9BACI|nr:aspartate kinase [Bacillus taeanensis]RBW71543.1 aspartate kinase [Bacillus taeanensis]